jgi:hypothetical protein
VPRSGLGRDRRSSSLRLRSFRGAKGVSVGSPRRFISSRFVVPNRPAPSLPVRLCQPGGVCVAARIRLAYAGSGMGGRIYGRLCETRGIVPTAVRRGNCTVANSGGRTTACRAEAVRRPTVTILRRS